MANLARDSEERITIRSGGFRINPFTRVFVATIALKECTWEEEVPLKAREIEWCPILVSLGFILVLYLLGR